MGNLEESSRTSLEKINSMEFGQYRKRARI